MRPVSENFDGEMRRADRTGAPEAEPPGACAPEPPDPGGTDTTADCVVALPPRLVAVTAQPSAYPASAVVTRYVGPVAPAMAAPSRSHCTASVCGIVPDHCPVEQVSALPTAAVPATPGAPVDVGGTLNVAM